LGLIILQQYTGFVKLDPSKYYVTTVPVEITPTLIILLNIATLAICEFVLIAPSYMISHIQPSKSMHFE
jgi:lipoprotein-releasing system permease protein